MQKTNMALLIQRLLFLGIILLLANHYVKSSPARIPVKDVKGKETSDPGHTDNEVRNSVVQSREEKTGKSWRFLIGSWNSFNVGLQNKVMLIMCLLKLMHVLTASDVEDDQGQKPVELQEEREQTKEEGEN